MYNGTDAPTITVQFAIAGTWTNVPSTDLLTVDFKRGRERPDQRFDAGSASVILDNASGVYDPDITTGPWTSGGASYLRAGLQMRIIGTWSGVPYILFAGFMETPSVDQGFAPTVTLTFTDGMALIAKAPAPGLSDTAVGRTDMEVTSARVTRMLDLMGWPSADRSISTGTVQMLMEPQNRPILDVINDCVNCEVGKFYVGRDGTAHFEVLNDKFTKVTRLQLSDSQATNTVEYEEIETQPGALQLTNQAVVNRMTSVVTSTKDKRPIQFIATDTASANSYGTSTVTVTAPTKTTDAARHIAWLLARQNADPQSRVTKIGFSALGLAALYPDFLSLEIGDQLIVNRTTVDGRAMTWYCVTEGIQSTITPDSWRVTINTSPMNPYTVTI